MQVIKRYTGLEPIENGQGDTIREYSFLLDTFNEFFDVVSALKTIELNTYREALASESKVTISAKTLADMDKAVENFNLGKVSEVIDLSDEFYEK